MNRHEILRVVDVVLEGAEPASARMPINLVLEAGTRVWIRVDEMPTWSFGDLAEGLLPPAGGCVEFMGEDWSAMRATRQSEARAQIGRVFKGEGWVSNLSVLENVALSQLHHTRRPAEEVFHEAERLAGIVGIRGFPDVLPDRLPFGEMKRMEWIRAFMGTPRLVVMETPEQGVSASGLDGLRVLVDDAARRGAGILGVVTEGAIWDDPLWVGRRLRFRPATGVLEEVQL